VSLGVPAQSIATREARGIEMGAAL